MGWDRHRMPCGDDGGETRTRAAVGCAALMALVSLAVVLLAIWFIRLLIDDRPFDDGSLTAAGVAELRADRIACEHAAPSVTANASLLDVPLGVDSNLVTRRDGSTCATSDGQPFVAVEIAIDDSTEDRLTAAYHGRFLTADFAPAVYDIEGETQVCHERVDPATSLAITIEDGRAADLPYTVRLSASTCDDLLGAVNRRADG